MSNNASNNNSNKLPMVPEDQAVSDFTDVVPSFQHRVNRSLNDQFAGINLSAEQRVQLAAMLLGTSPSPSLTSTPAMAMPIPSAAGFPPTFPPAYSTHSVPMSEDKPRTPPPTPIPFEEKRSIHQTPAPMPAPMAVPPRANSPDAMSERSSIPSFSSSVRSAISVAAPAGENELQLVDRLLNECNNMEVPVISDREAAVEICTNSPIKLLNQNGGFTKNGGSDLAKAEARVDKALIALENEFKKIRDDLRKLPSELRALRKKKAALVRIRAAFSAMN